MTCSKCGGTVMPTGVCAQCGYNEQLELEIGAFMTPHINRARIVLVAVGLLYVFFGWRSYSDVAEMRAMLAHYNGSSDPDVARVQHVVDIAYYIVIFVIGAGLANIVLAAIAGKQTMLAFNIAAGIFLIHTGLQIYLAGGLFLTSWLWWVTVIALGLGYQAALKAQKLRAGTPPGTIPTATARL